MTTSTNAQTVAVEKRRQKEDRSSKLKPKQRAFLAAYAECATVTHAAKAVEIARRTHYRWLEKHPEYVNAFAEAKEDSIELLEGEARRRAVSGVKQPVYYQGKQVGSTLKYSDTLLIFLLKAARPEVYRERYEVRGIAEERPVLDPGRDKLTDEELDQLLDLLKAKQAKEQASGRAEKGKMEAAESRE